MSDSLKLFNDKLIKCRLCPRLVEHRETVGPPGLGWRKPVPGFGDPNAWLGILGLAPSPQGGNRTGRIFTGDKSAVFLIKCLYEAGFANQPTSISKDDGLLLYDCYITAAVKCVPPMHKPTLEEYRRCTQTYLYHELTLLPNLNSILALGRVGFDAYYDWARTIDPKIRKEPFIFGKSYAYRGLPTLYASYHPSPQNTNTGRLTEEMFVSLLKKIKGD